MDKNFQIDNTVLVKYTGEDSTVVIPDSVTVIGDRAFEGCKGIAEVIIPEGVVSINYMAFYNCHGLESITLPESLVTVETHAFMWNGIKSITVPKNVCTVGAFAFFGCAKLESAAFKKQDGWETSFARHMCNEHLAASCLRGSYTDELVNNG